MTTMLCGKDAMKRPVGLVLGHPSPLLRAGFSSLLQQLPNIELWAEAATPECLVAAANRLRPELLVLASEFRSALKRIRKPPRVLLLSPHAHAGEDESRETGCAFSSETDSPDKLLDTLRHLAECRQPRIDPIFCADCRLKTSFQPPHLPLSPREREVFEWIAAGQSTGQIAARLGISVKTVESHRDNIKNKLGLASGTALNEAALLWRRGMRLPLPPR